MQNSTSKVQKYDLRAIRKELKMSQSDAAGSVGVSLRKWQRIEQTASLEQVTEFVLANAGRFVYPEHPFDLFKIRGQIFMLSDIKKPIQ